MGWNWPEEPLRISVSVSTDDEILELRKKVAELEEKCKELQARADRAEYKFRCESIVNQELVDLLRATNIEFRPSLEARPW